MSATQSLPGRTLALLLVCLLETVSAWGQQAEKPLEMADCLTLIHSDSVHLFFDSNFALTNKTCAYFRRECRIDVATGDFVGPARDYRQHTNKLLREIHYVGDRRNGPYEEYHDNKQVAVRGQYTDGKRSGTWQFWYEDGSPWQTLQWTGHAQPSLQVLAFWDETGQQQVSNGEGTWQGKTEGAFPTRFGGPIVHGYQQGEWESRDARSGEVRTIEEFSKGRLKQGQQLVAQSLELVGRQHAAQAMKYTTRPSLEIQVADPLQQAEPLHLGQNCEQQVRAREATNAIMEVVLEGRGESAIQLPFPGQMPNAYQHALLRLLNNDPGLSQWLPQQEGNRTRITADVDERGRLHNIAAATKEFADAITPLLIGLGDWKPATVKGKQMPGRIEIELRRERGQLQSLLRTNLATLMLPGATFNSK